MTSRPSDEPRPDVGKARAELERVKKQRGRVETLIEELLSEKQQNNFAANMFVARRRNP